MRQLVLHIGLRKTGSSALQELLSQNGELLKGHGVDYPKTMLGYPAHQELAWCLMKPQPMYVTDLPPEDEVYRYYQEKIDLNVERSVTTLLSSEDLSLLSLDYDSLSRLKGHFERFNPLIVFYRRAPVDYLVSNYQHAVLRGRETKDFKEYAFSMYKLLFADAAAIRRIWSSVFGTENVKALLYDMSAFEKRSVFSSFLSEVFDVELADDAYRSYRSNTGVSTAATEYMLNLNRSDLSDEVIASLKQKIRKVEVKSDKEDFLRRNLTPQDLATLRGIFK